MRNTIDGGDEGRHVQCRRPYIIAGLVIYLFFFFHLFLFFPHAAVKYRDPLAECVGVGMCAARAGAAGLLVYLGLSGRTRALDHSIFFPFFIILFLSYSGIKIIVMEGRFWIFH